MQLLAHVLDSADRSLVRAVRPVEDAFVCGLECRGQLALASQERLVAFLGGDVDLERAEEAADIASAFGALGDVEEPLLVADEVAGRRVPGRARGGQGRAECRAPVKIADTSFLFIACVMKPAELVG